MLGIGGGGTRLPDVGRGFVASVPASALGCPPVAELVGGGGGRSLPEVNPPVSGTTCPPDPPDGGGGKRLPEVNPPVAVTAPPDGGGKRLPDVKPPVFDPALPPVCATVPAAPPDDPGSDVNVPLHAYETVATPT